MPGLKDMKLTQLGLSCDSFNFRRSQEPHAESVETHTRLQYRKVGLSRMLERPLDARLKKFHRIRAKKLVRAYCSTISPVRKNKRKKLHLNFIFE